MGSLHLALPAGAAADVTVCVGTACPLPGRPSFSSRPFSPVLVRFSPVLVRFSPVLVPFSPVLVRFSLVLIRFNPVLVQPADGCARN